MLSIIIVNWNAGQQLVDAVTSIAQYQHNLVLSVVIVDNASTDDSLARVEALKGLRFKLKIIRNAENRGFGAACNQGAALSRSEYLLFLNPDARLFENSLSIPLAFMKRPENVDVGIAGIQLVDENNKITRSCSRFPTVGTILAQALGINRLPSLRHLSQAMSEWGHDSTQQVDQVMGAFFLIRNSAFVFLNGFDERFFVYFEEVDLSLRAKQRGWSSVYLAQAQAYHKGGGVSEQVKAHRLYYSICSRIHYSFKHFNRIEAWTVSFITLIIEPITRLIRGVVRVSPGEVLDTARGYIMFWKDVPRIFIKIHHLKVKDQI
jgi:GT2 family glycosyltransferase